MITTFSIHELAEGHYVISENDCWRPGAYSSFEAACYAFEFEDSDLQTLQDSKNGGFISVRDLGILEDQLCEKALRKEQEEREARNECGFQFPWHRPCDRQRFPGSSVCKKHMEDRCHCGKQANRACAVMSSFVCGALLCKDCECLDQGPLHAFRSKKCCPDVKYP